MCVMGGDESGRMPVAEYIVYGGRGYATATHTHLAYIASTAAQKDETGCFTDVGCIGLPGPCSTKARLVACPTGVALFRRCY